MSNFNQDNIDFTINEYTPTTVVNRVSTATYNALIHNKGKKSINSIEIDWNNAELSPSDNPTEGLVNSSVNTTGQLLKNIENLQAQVNILITLVKGLYSALEA